MTVSRRSGRVSDEYIEAVADVMVKANWHTYQVLTKRSKRMAELLSTKLKTAAEAHHIWWGVSVEDKKYGIPRITELRRSPATVRCLSIEPLLEDLGTINLDGVHWAIVGGESGCGARPIRREWVISIREQCAHSRVPFFFKQWGAYNKKRAGREAAFRSHPSFPARSGLTSRFHEMG